MNCPGPRGPRRGAMGRFGTRATGCHDAGGLTEDRLLPENEADLVVHGDAGPVSSRCKHLGTACLAGAKADAVRRNAIGSLSFVLDPKITHATEPSGRGHALPAAAFRPDVG
jgi:hypothetical protein